MAQHPTSACHEEKGTFLTLPTSTNSVSSVSLLPPLCVPKLPLSLLTVGEGTLNNIQDEPDHLGPGSLLWKVPIGSQLLQPQPSTPDLSLNPQIPSHSHIITSPA
ncbi:hypothetical protein EV424DRAFT_1545872 [Suillus variegatus]|nr:hypothetical protein EV424DRAFT_1545872 [Suillus variegatus]